MRVGIIGAGYIGEKRAEALNLLNGRTLEIIADIKTGKAKKLAGKYGCRYTDDWREVVGDKKVDVVNVATTNDYLAKISISAIENGKHVLCEKPPGRNLKEALKIAKALKKNCVKLKVGFNHRFHPAMQKAHKMVEKGILGDLFFIRCIYGHGGRKGYGKEWRMIPEISGGGHLVDQGIHIIDLFRWFMGDFKEVFLYKGSFFWESRAEDNAFCLLKTGKGKLAQLHTGATQWKNKFLFEIFGKKGFLLIDGLGGSYGVETLVYGNKKRTGKRPEEKVYRFHKEDFSFLLEWKDFFKTIAGKRNPSGNIEDGIEAMKTVGALYKSAKEKKVIKLGEK